MFEKSRQPCAEKKSMADAIVNPSKFSNSRNNEPFTRLLNYKYPTRLAKSSRTMDDEQPGFFGRFYSCGNRSSTTSYPIDLYQYNL